jgi:hypothetical protein
MDFEKYYESLILIDDFWKKQWTVSLKYCDGLLKALRYGTRKPRVTLSTTELRLLSNEGRSNHATEKLLKTWVPRQRIQKQVSVTTAR